MEVQDPTNLLDFTNKTVFVTGSSRGIGAGIAKRFAAAGANVVIHYKSHKEDALVVETEINEFGGKTLLVCGDVSSYADVQKMFAEIDEAFGVVDVMVNNAGIYPHADLLQMTEEEWDEMLDISLKSVFLCTQAAARSMVDAGKKGAIVNISSLSAINPAPGHCHYTAAKAGVMMFTKTAALELGKYGIRINAVGPGLINSPVLAQAWPEGVSNWMSKVPLGRIGEPEDVADACLFLASNAARFITGVHLLIEGGIYTNPIY
ncbi:MAG TPA: SDR family NAD(P)-dependent oxidoreductase [Anaerolineaceae bacterium]|jgi:NAD(P)-dependent dehydrogenase (short-subunit alcohol dehydrogenase family)|nr:SDR family NAD(P)-dependent oxidoreductase [Anaerolineaceae bacterium]HUM62387.1 SDR family NAD(P)-dependent oxidoreductase [Anaerolineaceae bacterium]